MPEAAGEAFAIKVGDSLVLLQRALGREAEDMASAEVWRLPEKSQVSVIQLGSGPSANRLRVQDAQGRQAWMSIMAKDGSRILDLAARSGGEDAAKSGLAKSLRWELNFGPLAVNCQGVALKPQFKFGGEFEKMRLEAGISDVRDGLRVTANCASTWEATAEGKSLTELHKKVRFDAPGLQQALQASQKVLEGTKLSQCPDLASVAQGSPETISEIMTAMPDGDDESRSLISLRVQIQAKIGATARVNLGWRDTQGYHMVGIGGSVSSAIKVGANLFAGIHSSGKTARVVIGISNFTFQYTFPLPRKDKKLGSHLLTDALVEEEWAADFLVASSAQSLAALHKSALLQEKETPGFAEALDTADYLLTDKRLSTAVAQLLEVQPRRLQEVWAGPKQQAQGPGRPDLFLRIHASSSLAASCEERLSRCGTSGLSLTKIPVDAQTAVKAAATVLGVLAARYEGEQSAKLVLFLGRFTFEYSFSMEVQQGAGQVLKGLLSGRTG
eukprot:TRINITY_DN15951_c0_g1_i1.p1 TRINITY_DN15951_c0_g1~~TRINITY_DN15951_c0_g1_i1.p1  ORF type:complete len:545 (+),score=126.93 TRINITY_DN15951_c0_g1_i1:136-1635(+)